MNYATVEMKIPDTQEARTAINVAARKIWNAHGAAENDYFIEVKQEDKKAAKKANKPGPKPKQAKDAGSDAQLSKPESVESDQAGKTDS